MKNCVLFMWNKFIELKFLSNKNIKQRESKICSMCNIEKYINNFYKKNSECKDCNSERGLRRYYENKDNILNQRKIYHEKNRDELFQKQNDRYIYFTETMLN